MKSLLAGFAVLASASPGLADTFNYSSLTLGDLGWFMESRAEPIGANKDDLGSPPRVGGLCRSFGDVLIDFPSMTISECITPEATAQLKSCSMSLDGPTGPATASGTAKCFTCLSKTLDFSKVLDRTVSALPNTLSCMSKALVRASRLSEPEKKAAVSVIDGIKATAQRIGREPGGHWGRNYPQFPGDRCQRK